MPSSAKRARRASDALQYEYPEHLRACVEDIPRSPGVYTFHGKEGLLPLYIGKSINMRGRVMDHCRTPEEASLLRQTTSVSYVEMAGDVGARLLEAQMVKRQMPLYNKLLRKVPRQFSIHLYRGQVSIVHSAQYDVTSSPMLYGLYSSPQSALKSLRRIADEHRLCYSLVGLERLPAGRPAFVPCSSDVLVPVPGARRSINMKSACDQLWCVWSFRLGPSEERWHWKSRGKTSASSMCWRLGITWEP